MRAGGLAFLSSRRWLTSGLHVAAISTSTARRNVNVIVQHDDARTRCTITHFREIARGQALSCPFAFQGACGEFTAFTDCTVT